MDGGSADNARSDYLPENTEIVRLQASSFKLEAFSLRLAV
jgi:hypothetical protein